VLWAYEGVCEHEEGCALIGCTCILAVSVSSCCEHSCWKPGLPCVLVHSESEGVTIESTAEKGRLHERVCSWAAHPLFVQSTCADGRPSSLVLVRMSRGVLDVRGLEGGECWEVCGIACRGWLEAHGDSCLKRVCDGGGGGGCASGCA